MDMKKVMLLVGALIVAAGSAFGVRMLLSGSPAPNAQAVVIEQQEPAPEGVHVLVAQNTLPVGTIITKELVAFQPWPEDMISNAYFFQEERELLEGRTATPTKIEDVLGQVVRLPISAGQPLSQSALVGPGQSGFLAAALNPGMRAVTVPIDNISGVAGFVFPGDRVDILLTHDIDAKRRQGEFVATGQMKVAETIARNVRVLAIDQRVDNTTVDPQSGRSVTFEVPPKMVEKVQVARMLGKLQLSLRSVKEQKLAFEQAIANGTIDVDEDDDETVDQLAMEFSSSQRPDDRGSTYTSGAEVSQFAFGEYGLPRGERYEAALVNGETEDSGPTVTIRKGRKGAKTVSPDEDTAPPQRQAQASADPQPAQPTPDGPVIVEGQQVAVYDDSNVN